jgi:hypothetical protein
VKQHAEATLLAVRVGVGAAVALACRAEHWEISEPIQRGADAGPALDAAAPPLCDQSASEGIPLEPSALALGPGQAGRWLARLSGEEALQFPSDLLELVLDPAGAQLHFETGTSVPMLIDPRRGYLCHAPGASTCATASGFVAAFSYTLANVAARDSILSFRVFLEQPWSAWCQLQAPVIREIPGCGPSYDVEAAYADRSWGDTCAVLRADEWFDIDCDRLATVERHACVCNDTGCRAAARMVEVNLRLVAAGVLEGALWFAADHAQVLHFERQPDPSTP